MVNITFERPKKEDVIRIHDFFDLVIRDTFAKNSIDHLKEIILEEKTSKRSCLRQDMSSDGKERYFIIAKSGDDIVGSIEYGPSNEIIRNNAPEVAGLKEVGTVYVHPEYQGQGIGRLLLEQIGMALKEHGYTEFLMDSGYKSAQSVWSRKFGETYKTLTDYWGEGDHHMIWRNSVKDVLN